MKLPVRCGVSDGGRECGRNLGEIVREGFPGPLFFRGVNDYDGLTWEERHYSCPKHGAVQVHNEDLLHRALTTRGKPIMARRERWRDWRDHH